MQKASAAIVIAVLILGGCGQRAAMVPETGEVSPIAEGNNQFALGLYAKLCKDNTDNLFFSPYSISTAMAMTYAGARGETEKEMAQVLNFPVPQDRLHSDFASLTAKLRSEENGNQLRIANRLWGQQSYDFLPEFLRVTREDYGAELALLDFGKEEDAARTINAWVDEQTEHKIRDAVSPGNLKPPLMLVNAIYFKGRWQYQFRKTSTREAPFTLTPAKSVNVPMMHQLDSFKYGETDDARILQLPYLGNDTSMFILLPKSVDGLTNLERRLTLANLRKWLSALRQEEVRVSLPRFTVTSQFALKEVLGLMGMSSAFNFGAADFSGMDGTRNLVISAMIHKAVVDVNEEGTEAAAVLDPALVCADKGPPEFLADHPFVFLIYSNKTGVILFMGRVTNPKTSSEVPMDPVP